MKDCAIQHFSLICDPLKMTESETVFVVTALQTYGTYLCR